MQVGMRGVIKLLGSEVTHIFLSTLHCEVAQFYMSLKNLSNIQQLYYLLVVFFIVYNSRSIFDTYDKQIWKFHSLLCNSSSVLPRNQKWRGSRFFFLHFFCGFLKHYDRVRMGPQGGELIRRSWMVVSRRCSAAQCWRWRQGRLDASRRRRLREEGEE